MSINEFSIENMKAELARALNKADEDAKTIADLRNEISLFREIVNSVGMISDRDGIESIWVECTHWKPLVELLANNKIDHPLLLQDEAG